MEKKSRFKITWILFLLLSLVWMGNPGAAKASDVSDSVVFSYRDYNGGAEITKYTCEGGCPEVLEIPAKIDGKKVLAIGREAFLGCPAERILLPEGVKEIGEYAFENCKQLKSMQLPDSVTIIGPRAFIRCEQLESIQLSQNLKKIESGTFEKCSVLSNVVLPEGIEEIEGEAFRSCENLGEIVIPQSMTQIGRWTFAVCTGLTKITIPDTVTAVGEYAFYDCEKLEEITLSEHVASVGEKAFEQCTGLKRITYPVGLPQEDFDAGFKLTFQDDGQGGLEILSSKYGILPGIINGKTVTAIGRSAFYNSNYAVEIPDSIKTIGPNAFLQSKINRIVLPEGVETIGEGAFQNCFQLTSITIPQTVKSIGDVAFKDCQSLTSISIPDGIQVIGDRMFNNCYELTEVSLPDSVAKIDYSAFYRCKKLQEIVLPKAVKEIGETAFTKCESLRKITLPAGLSSIGVEAFSECGALAEVQFQGSRGQWRKVAVADGNVCLTDAEISFAVSDGSDDNCLVAFDAAGVMAIPVQYVKEGELAVKPAEIPKREGYWFDGWYLGEEKWDFSAGKVTRDITLRARWEDEEKVSVRIDGAIFDQRFYNNNGEKRRVIPVGEEITIGYGTPVYEDGIVSVTWSFNHPEILSKVKELSGFQCSARANAPGETSVIISNSSQVTHPVFDAQTKTISEHFRVVRPVEAITMKERAALALGESAPIEAATVPSGNYARAVSGFTLTSSDESVVKVSDDLIMTGVGYGTAVLTASTVRGGLTARCEVTVAKEGSCKHPASARKVVSVKKAAVKKDGTRTLQCADCGKEFTETIFATKKIQLSFSSCTYNGKNRKPSVAIRDINGLALKAGRDYTVTYPKKSKLPGRYTVAVKFQGSNYTGSAEKTFTVKPKATSVTSLKAKKKGFTVKWKKQTGVTGYEVYYSTKSNFAKKQTKYTEVKSAKATSKTIGKLKGNKRYYVKIRSYKNVKADGKTKKIYSGWSKVRTAAVKK